MEKRIKESSIGIVLQNVWLVEIPSYANKIYYSLGFLSMVSFFILVITGIVLTFYGPDWWLTTSVGTLIRSIHLWAVQAFVVFILLHLLIVLLTGGYRPPRRLNWVLGILMFIFALGEAEFGYVLRDDFSSQWRTLQGADFYNGSGLGILINNLNYAQIYGIHVVVIPFLLIGLMFLHYALVKIRGVAKPYRKDVAYRTVKANHTSLFLRGFVVTCVIVLLAVLFPSPLIAPITIKQIATQDPSLMAKTLLSEIDHSSDTATYVDNIAPYTYDTKKVYVETPYSQYVLSQQYNENMLDVYNLEDKQTQDKNLKAANDYFDKNGEITTLPNTDNPVIPMVSSLVLMAQSGLYESALKGEEATNYNPTYVLRYLSDTGVLEDKADKLTITTPQYGMLREETGSIPPGAWWLAPLGFMDNTILKNDDNQDRDGAEIIGVFVLLLLAFPYIPFVNQFPDKLNLYKFIWKDKSLQHAK